MNKFIKFDRVWVNLFYFILLHFFHRSSFFHIPVRKLVPGLNLLSHYMFSSCRGIKYVKWSHSRQNMTVSSILTSMEMVNDLWAAFKKNLQESWPDFPRVGRILHNHPVLCFTINKYNITQPICVYRTRLTIPAIQAHKFAVAVPRWKNRRLLLCESGIDYVNTENLIVLFGTKKRFWVSGSQRFLNSARVMSSFFLR